MADIYNFKRYRNVYALLHCMKAFCRAVVNSKGAKGVCPRPQCIAKGYWTLKWKHPFKVAYCHRCSTCIDALGIVSAAKGIGLREACEEIQLLGEDC